MSSGVTSSHRIGLAADASPPGCGDARAAFRAALAAAPWQRSPGSRFVRLRSRRPRSVNGCIRWLPEVAIIPPWSPAGASRPGSPCVREMLPRVASPLRAAQPGLTSTQPRRAGPTCGCRSMQDVYSCVRAVLWPTCTHEYLALRGRPRACGTPVASRSRETRRGALAPLRDVRAAWHARATFHFPGRRPSPAPLCGRRPCRF